jgi:hemerythrin superfamily protein
MAQTRKKSRRTSTRAAARGNGSKRRNARSAASEDAIALLKADHREVEGWFEDFEKSRSSAKKQELASKICFALRTHATIEEEIFYPAFLEATDEKDLHHEAAVEHDGAKKLIAEIEAADADDDYFDAKVTVLSEMIKHHVKEEEQRGGMFAKARGSDMDLAALGAQLKERKAELMSEAPQSDGRKRKAPAALVARRSNSRGQQAGTRS